MRLFGLKTCDTCRKALKEIEAAGQPVEFIDLRSFDDLAARLPGWIEAIGAARLVNTRSTTWRGLEPDARAQAETDPAALLTKHPTLIKRPVVESRHGVTAGWDGAARSAHGLG